ncbi:UNVERIFIED_CONTAM: hypothetical protein FKN15_004340 [Acipenser sinensis]
MTLLSLLRHQIIEHSMRWYFKLEQQQNFTPELCAETGLGGAEDVEQTSPGNATKHSSWKESGCG